MITVYLINKVMFLINFILTTYFHNFTNHLVQLGSNLSALTIPTTLNDIYQLCCLFLPTGTLALLLTITAVLFTIRLGISLIYFVVHLFGIR